MCIQYCTRYCLRVFPPKTCSCTYAACLFVPRRGAAARLEKARLSNIRYRTPYCRTVQYLPAPQWGYLSMFGIGRDWLPSLSMPLGLGSKKMLPHSLGIYVAGSCPCNRPFISLPHRLPRGNQVVPRVDNEPVPRGPEQWHRNPRRLSSIYTCI